MTARVHKVDPVMQKSFNEYYRTLEPGPVTSLEPPIKGIDEICKRFGTTPRELAVWRRLAFPLYHLKGRHTREKYYGNPERILAWFRWRDLVQSGYISIDVAAKGL